MSYEKNQQIFRKAMVAGDALSQSAVRAQPVVIETGARGQGHIRHAIVSSRNSHSPECIRESGFDRDEYQTVS